MLVRLGLFRVGLFALGDVMGLVGFEWFHWVGCSGMVSLFWLDGDGFVGLFLRGGCSMGLVALGWLHWVGCGMVA